MPLRSVPRALVALLLSVSTAAPLAAQISVPVSLQAGLPQGEFAENVKFAGGLGIGGLIGIAPGFAFRGEFGFMIYGNETRRVPLGGGALGLVNVDVTTTNAIVGGGIGAQLGTPGPRMMPYVGGLIGFSSFNTTSRVQGTNSDDQPFASSTNASDNVFAKTALAGLYVPFGGGKILLDLGVRHTWNGEEVEYLTKDDITEDAEGNVVLSPRRTRADLLTITVGLTFRPGGAR